MIWTDFFLYLALFYLVYYAIIVVIDVLRKPHFEASKKGEAYTFQTDLSDFGENPTVIEDDDPMIHLPESLELSPATKEEWVKSNEESEDIEFEINDANPVRSTGGVTNLNSLFALAKEGTIEMKKKIVFA